MQDTCALLSWEKDHQVTLLVTFLWEDPSEQSRAESAMPMKRGEGAGQSQRGCDDRGRTPITAGQCDFLGCLTQSNSEIFVPSPSL